MARQSFTLREVGSEGGSYLQYVPSSASASSSASAFAGASATYLRADELQFAPEVSILSTIEYFEGYASDYDEVKLSWGAALEDLRLDYISPYEALVVYSPIGHPATIPEGQVLIRSRSVSEFVHKPVTGLWAYYTLFIHYLSYDGVDDYYEPVATLSVLIPNKYEIPEDMFSHIPSWYQGLDEENGGDLKKFLTVFGRDAEYMRTVLDYMLSMKDPSISEVSDLDDIAQDLGISLRSGDLGADRLRKLLDNIGEIRRTKGTLSAIQKEISAITASPVTVDFYNDYAEGYVNGLLIKVQPQRCNLVKDPKFKNGVQTGLDGGIPISLSTLAFDVGLPGTGWVEEDTSYSTVDTFSGQSLDGAVGAWFDTTSVNEENIFSTTEYVSGYLFDGGVPSSTAFTPLVGSLQKWVGYPDPENGEYGVLETLNSDVPIIAGDVFYFSIQAYDTDVRIQDSILSVGFYTSGGVSEGQLIVKSESYQEINGLKYWKITIPDDYNLYDFGGYQEPMYGLATISIRFEPITEDSPAVFENFTKVLLERNFIGEYFDGDDRLGGWITDGETSISDYRWRNPTYPDTTFEGDAFPVYSANYQKTKAILNKMLPSILPVQSLIKSGYVYSNKDLSESPMFTFPNYILKYDYIPGEEILYL